jgi:hypothetical protein
MIPYEDLFDDEDYLVPGSGAARPIVPVARQARRLGHPELAIHEAPVCRACGKGLSEGDYCGKCAEEIRALKRMHRLDGPEQVPVGPWTPRTFCLAALAVAAMVWAFVELTPLIADWIAGGPR